ncbi:MAG: VWA domain-containing protein [Chloroflexales bacterium]|nr:VWA domain-containing protein [Chloroflexales bacterium]
MSLTLSLRPSVITLGRSLRQQLCYALVTIAADVHNGRGVNWAFVADASRSMRIPIISDSQFRTLVRAGGAQETLVDGVPVWQLSGPVPDDIRANAPSALDHTARALHSVVERLDAADRFALIACAETATTLITSTPGDGRAVMVGGIGRLKTLRLGEETDLARGLRLALDELAQGRKHLPNAAARLLLLTDGFTQNPDACRDLAREATTVGVAISTIGLGSDFQEALLTELADVSGGRALFAHRAEAIPAMVAQELAAARRVAAPSVALDIAVSAQATLRRATRVRPELAPLAAAPTVGDTQRIQLGAIAVDTPTVVLLEMIIEGDATNTQLAHLVLYENDSIVRRQQIVATYAAEAAAPHSATLDAVARANAARLQLRGLEAVATGDRLHGASLLRNAAARLRELGETELASKVLEEAASVERTGQTSRLGAKELAYATRRLGDNNVV